MSIGVNGYIKNQLGAGIPYASVLVLDGEFAQTGEGTAASNTGFFTLDVDPNGEPYALQISSVGYKPKAVPLSSWRNGGTITMEPAFVTGEGVTVYAHPKKPFPIWALALPLLVLAADKDKRGKVSGIGKVDAKNTLLLVGGGIILWKGTSIVDKILVTLGLKDSKATEEVNELFTQGAEKNPWSPDFWRYGSPAQTRILTQDAADAYATGLHNAFGLIDDDEDGVYNIFRAMPTQSCVSFLAMKFAEKYGKDLYSWLRGGAWYAGGFDHLSDAELNRVNQIVLAKPKYW